MTWPFAQGTPSTGARPAPTVVRPFADNAGYWPGLHVLEARAGSRALHDRVHERRRHRRTPCSSRRRSSYAVVRHADVPSSAEHARYAYGLTTSMHRGVRLVEHGGSIDGFGASVRMLPDHKAAVIILVNKSGAQLQKTSERALELLAPLQPTAPRAAAHIAMDPAEMAKYVGIYTNPPRRIELTTREGKLYLRRGTTDTEVTKVGDLRFATTPATGAPAPGVRARSGPRRSNRVSAYEQPRVQEGDLRPSRDQRSQIADFGIAVAGSRSRPRRSARSSARRSRPASRARRADTMRPEILGTHGIVAAGGTTRSPPASASCSRAATRSTPASRRCSPRRSARSRISASAAKRRR